jgi:uncharacterized membrane protein
MEATKHNDELIASYLARLESLSLSLSPGTRQDLLQDLREHITVQRAELTPETEAGVRSILDRLGDPAAIVAAARENDPTPPHFEVQPVVLPPQRKGPPTAVVVVLSVLAAVVLGCLLVGAGAYLFLTPSGGASTGRPAVVTDVQAPTPSPS